jgi:hypothetical protein
MTTAISTPQKKTKTATKKTTHSESKGASAKKDDLNDYIAAAAYFKAESRGFEPGHELDDWLEAEIELMSIQQTH